MTSTEAIAKMSHFAAARANLETKLIEAGLDACVDTTIGELLTKVIELCQVVTASACRQAVHNTITNVPTGIISRWENTPEAAFLQGAVSGISSAIQWDVKAAIEAAAMVLEDSNVHDKAAIVREWADEVGG